MAMERLMFIFIVCRAAVVPYERCDNFILKRNWDYWGNDLGPPMIQISYADCCDQCSKNEKCLAFTWRRDWSMCYLKSSIGNGGQFDTNAIVSRHQERTNISDEYQFQDSGIYANDSIEDTRSHGNVSTSSDTQNYNGDSVDDNRNMTDLSEYTDNNNYTSSWIDGEKNNGSDSIEYANGNTYRDGRIDDKKSGPITLNFRGEKKYEVGCSAIYEQCGGIGWKGPRKCCNGLACNFHNDYYSQCSTTSSTSNQATTTVSTSTTKATAQGCSAIYGQCGGIGWKGPTKCCDGLACNFHNDYYSQCSLTSSTSKQVTTTVSTSTTKATAPANPTAGDCNGSRCGCYKEYCWAYVNENRVKPGDWWCYTQKAGVYGKKGIWETCGKDSDCYWNRTCGNCFQYKGNEDSQRDICDSKKAPDIVHGPMRGGLLIVGRFFNDLDDIGTFSISTPKSIDLRCGSYVDAIKITYQTAVGTLRATTQRGGNGGGHLEFILDADERIVKVTGATGMTVDRLQFFTNKGRISSVCGGYDLSADHDFSEIHPGYVLSYISGRASRYVGLIQFHWVREEVQYILTSVHYDLNKAKQTATESVKGTYMAELINRGSTEQTQSYTKTITVSESDTWSLNVALTVGVSATAKAGIPLFASAEVTVSASVTFGFTYGKTKTVEHSNAYTLATVVPAKSKVQATLIIFESVIDVPFTTDLTIVYADGTQVTKKGESGTFTGVQAGRTVTEYGTPIPI